MKLDDVQETAREQFSKQSHRYGQGHILQNVDDVKEALAHIPLPAGSRALDVAAGAGHTGLHLAEVGYNVTLADIAAPMLARARETATQRGLAIQTNQHPAESLPYPDGLFDLVSCRVAAHHFSSPDAFLAESARVLRQGGYFLLIDGAAPDDAPEAEEWIHAVEKFRDPSHNRLLTSKCARRLCEENGLRVRTIALAPFKMPDLEWYFDTAATSAENRLKVRALLETASPAIRDIFNISQEDGKVVWWWQRLVLVAQKE